MHEYRENTDNFKKAESRDACLTRVQASRFTGTMFHLTLLKAKVVSFFSIVKVCSDHSLKKMLAFPHILMVISTEGNVFANGFSTETSRHWVHLLQFVRN